MIVKRIDFEHGSIPSNILNAAIPMLVAQLLSLLYIIDRIYIARIPHIGTTALGAGRLMFSDYCDHHGFQQPVRQRRCSAFFHRRGKIIPGKLPKL